jgi:hypothetical protein
MRLEAFAPVDLDSYLAWFVNPYTPDTNSLQDSTDLITNPVGIGYLWPISIAIAALTALSTLY